MPELVHQRWAGCICRIPFDIGLLSSMCIMCSLTARPACEPSPAPDASGLISDAAVCNTLHPWTLSTHP